MSRRGGRADVWLITRGDGSERCLVCGLRHANHTFYVAETSWGEFPESVGRPVCSFIHAQILLGQEYSAMQLPYDQDVRLDK